MNNLECPKCRHLSLNLTQDNLIVCYCEAHTRAGYGSSTGCECCYQQSLLEYLQDLFEETRTYWDGQTDTIGTADFLTILNFVIITIKNLNAKIQELEKG